MSAAEPRSGTRAAGLACLLITSIGWGLNWPAMKVLLRELPPLFARGASGVASALLFAGVALAMGQTMKVPRHLIARMAAAAFLNVFAWMGLGTMSMRVLPVGQAALLVYTMPIWAMLLAWPVLKQRPTRRALAGLLLCVAGLWSLFGDAASHFDASQIEGTVLALAAAVLFAYGTVALRPLAEIPPIALLSWQLGLGCLPMLVIGVTIEHPVLAQVSGTGWSLMLYMTLFPMGVCYLTWFAALRRLPPASAALATLLTPVIGVLTAAYILGEPLGVLQVAALVLTLSGVGLALRR